MDQYFLIEQKRWVRRVLSNWRRSRLDHRFIPSGRGEIRLFTVVRNEMLRLPYFLSYYRQLGVTRFFVVDNHSDDGTLDYLLAQSDVHVWSTRETYTRQEAWVDGLIRRFGRADWSVVIDVEFIESMFSTVKSDPDFPDRFQDDRHAEEYFAAYVPWYNNQHYHSGIDYVTPHQAHTGQRAAIVEERQRKMQEQRLRRQEVNRQNAGLTEPQRTTIHNQGQAALRSVII
jgi:hypothetical protein